MLVDVLLVVGDQGLGDGLADGVDLGSVTTTADTDANVCFSLANNPNSYAFTPPEFRESLGLLSSTSPPRSPGPHPTILNGMNGRRTNCGELVETDDEQRLVNLYVEDALVSPLPSPQAIQWLVTTRLISQSNPIAITKNAP